MISRKCNLFNGLDNSHPMCGYNNETSYPSFIKILLFSKMIMKSILVFVFVITLMFSLKHSHVEATVITIDKSIVVSTSETHPFDNLVVKEMRFQHNNLKENYFVRFMDSTICKAPE